MVPIYAEIAIIKFITSTVKFNGMGRVIKK